MENLTKYFSNYLALSENLEFEKLPNYIQAILKDCLIAKFPEIPAESMLLSLNCIFATVISHYRSKVVFNGDDVIINYYGLNFLESGRGKDKPIEYMEDKIFNEAKAEINKEISDYHDWRLQQVLEDADDKYNSSKAQKETYIQNNSPRTVFEMRDATGEGFIDIRKELGFWHKGAVFLQLSEFKAFILSQNQFRKDLLTLVYESYNKGDTKAKITKSDRNSYPIKGVPTNLLAHSSLEGLISGEGRDNLMAFLNDGLARRSFVCYAQIPAMKEVVDLDEYIKERTENTARVDEILKDIRNYIREIINELNRDSKYVLTKEAEKVYYSYELYNRIRVEDTSKYNFEGLRAEIISRQWKALKLAGLIAIIEHPDSRVVTEKDFGMAIYQTEFYGGHIMKFYRDKPKADFEVLFSYLFTNMDKWISTADIRKQNFIHASQFARWFEQTLPVVEEMAYKQSYKIEMRRFGRNGKEYKLTRRSILDLTVQDKKNLMEDI